MTAFTISRHAELELDRRQIARDLVMQILDSPQQVVAAYGGRKAY